MPVHSVSSLYCARVHTAFPSTSVSERKSGRCTSQSGNSGEVILVRSTRSTNVRDDEGKASISVYTDTPPRTNALWVGISTRESRADPKLLQRNTGISVVLPPNLYTSRLAPIFKYPPPSKQNYTYRSKSLLWLMTTFAPFRRGSNLCGMLSQVFLPMITVFVFPSGAALVTFAK